MNQIDLKRISTPITTGIPHTSPQEVADSVGTRSFKAILQDKLDSSQGVNFSRHAMNRVMERNIDLSDENIERLNEGVKLAGEKGLDDTLILLDNAAFIVSVRNNTVITTVSRDEMTGNVFTNIDGTVVI
ncbi:MAG: flagellar protein [Oscillospiraceae bacterium]|nr:flagellar protein [Oscillospiraceae bacterium]